ncbi:MAG: glycoside hydrolase family 13 protein [Verrucomicrobia bacterium]|nr:glycoside hydrolase family 13 protein [Verrucomicrobiota bacterium]
MKLLNLMKRCSCAAALITFLLGAAVANAASPDWAAHAVWYQIFPERFRNGDLTNDPTPASLVGTWPDFVPPGWRVSPWTSDWYELRPWERDGKGFYVHAQLRRYGGDLQGIIDKLDYLKELGVNALYLNPIFESPSLHKYGAALYQHVDKHFGPDPAGDLKLFAGEDPADPATWKWTSADKLFLKVIEEVHRRDMRLIIDGVFNHVGISFWALQRAKRDGPDSRYAQWFHITRWDDPTTPADEFDYRGWSGIKDLPELARDEHNLHPEIREHFRHVVRRWMDPNGDGDPKDGIDGWRMDVAAEVPMGFWKDFRGWVKHINPDAYIAGEIWWDDYRAIKLRNAAPWLEQAFDGVMNYRFGDAVFQFFNRTVPIRATELGNLISAVHRDYGYRRSLGLQNLLGSHDTERIGSMVVNPKHRQDHQSSVSGNRSYSVRAPNAVEKQRWKQMVAFQFLAPGAPYIYYGDEVGMWGADDPDCRKPMLWPDLRFAAEREHPFGQSRPVNSVSPDGDMLAFHRRLAELRARHEALRTGEFEFTLLDDERRLVAFHRKPPAAGTSILAVFNASDKSVVLKPAGLKCDSFTGWMNLWTGVAASSDSMEVPSRWFVVLGRESR